MGDDFFLVVSSLESPFILSQQHCNEEMLVCVCVVVFFTIDQSTAQWLTKFEFER